MKTNPLDDVKQTLAEKIYKTFKNELLDYQPERFLFENPPADLGHIALPCFQFSKFLKKKPVEIAQTILDDLPEFDFIDQAQIKGAYLNFFLSTEFIEHNLFSSDIDQSYGDNESLLNQKMMVEFSAPNTNKPLHLGHCRNNSLGASIAKLLQSCGAQVIKANLVNDRGIHICKSMLAYQHFGENAEPKDKKGDHFVGDFYIQYNNASKEDASFEQKVKKMLLDWEHGNLELRALWQKMNQWTIDGFKQTYKRMNIEFDHWYFESETYLGGKELVKKALAEKRLEQSDDGAIFIELTVDKQEIKKILLRSDGTSVYMTQDLNTTLQKFLDYNLDSCFFVVGDEQEYHFRVLFQTLEKLGYDWAKQCEHISYGMIELPDGKMKSREGKVVDLDDLLDELFHLAYQHMQNRPYNDKESEDEVEYIAEQIGQSALKFFMLKTTPSKRIVFQAQESLSFDGMTGPYIQYTHARINSLLQKAQVDSFFQDGDHYQWSEDEKSILVDCMKLSRVISQAAQERNPSLLAQYVYEIARNYNRFYYEKQILKEEDHIKKARLNLSLICKIVINKSLVLLDIIPLNRM